MAIALWCLAGGASFRTIAAHFDVGKSTCATITGFKQACLEVDVLTDSSGLSPSKRNSSAGVTATNVVARKSQC